VKLSANIDKLLPDVVKSPTKIAQLSCQFSYRRSALLLIDVKLSACIPKLSVLFVKLATTFVKLPTTVMKLHTTAVKFRTNIDKSPTIVIKLHADVDKRRR
jgi:hypothetical protein